jgi:hypothetical protein
MLAHAPRAARLPAEQHRHDQAGAAPRGEHQRMPIGALRRRLRPNQRLTNCQRV